MIKYNSTDGIDCCITDRIKRKTTTTTFSFGIWLFLSETLHKETAMIFYQCNKPVRYFVFKHNATAATCHGQFAVILWMTYVLLLPGGTRLKNLHPSQTL